VKSGVAQNLIYRYHICSTVPKCLPHEQDDDDAGPVYDLDQDRSGFEGFTLDRWVFEVYTHASSSNFRMLPMYNKQHPEGFVLWVAQKQFLLDCSTYVGVDYIADRMGKESQIVFLLRPVRLCTNRTPLVRYLPRHQYRR